MAAQDALDQLERLLVQARECVARALTKDAPRDAPKLERQLALAQGAPLRALQAPIPFNPAPETISQAVTECVQASAVLEAPIPYFPPQMSPQKPEPLP